MANLQNAPLQNNFGQEELYMVLYLDQVYEGNGKNQEIMVDKGFPKSFGLIAVSDWPIYDGPDTSKLKPVAWARGQHIGTVKSADGRPGQWFVTCNIVFGDESRHPGSTLAVTAALVDESANNEWAIVGGTGDFTFAQGVIYQERVKTNIKEKDGKGGQLKRLYIRVLYRPVKRSQFRDAFVEFIPSEVDGDTLARKVGQGTFGIVHEANIGGTTVAVKFLQQGSLQADKDLKNEIEIFKTIRHQNLVSLVGACIERNALIYEFCPNGTLADRIFPDSTQDWEPLSWQDRVRIAGSICSGLKFLHDVPVAHCDLKPNNILFDAQGVCKICDFGLARVLKFTSDTATPVHYTGPKGNPFYWDPKFVNQKGKEKGELTRKSDVYSLGIILLQLVTGEGPNGLRDRVQLKLFKNKSADTEKKCQELVDAAILDDLNATSKQDALKMIELGLKCCSLTREERPDMATLCLMIESMVKSN